MPRSTDVRRGYKHLSEPINDIIAAIQRGTFEEAADALQQLQSDYEELRLLATIAISERFSRED